jgi:hypothetical protein
VLQEWEQVGKKKKEAGEQTYTDSIIACCLPIKINCGLKLRQSMGFMQSLLFLMGKGYLWVSDYSTLCRRQGILPTETSNQLSSSETYSQVSIRQA